MIQSHDYYIHVDFRLEVGWYFVSLNKKINYNRDIHFFIFYLNIKTLCYLLADIIFIDLNSLYVASALQMTQIRGATKQSNNYSLYFMIIGTHSKLRWLQFYKKNGFKCRNLGILHFLYFLLCFSLPIL